MKSIYISIVLILITATTTCRAQLNGISYTLAPAAEYLIMDQNSRVANGMSYGAQTGLGFGQNLELHFEYNSASLRSNLSSMINLDSLGIDEYKVKVQRIGGALRFNLAKGHLVPLITAGSGVQLFDGTGLLSSRQIYLMGGVGLKYSVADRYTVNVEARNISSLVDPFSLYNDPVIQEELLPHLRGQQALSNWGVGASVQFYLGGRKPTEPGEIDKYYSILDPKRRFPPVNIDLLFTHVDFHPKISSNQQSFAGARAGLSLSPYLGISGFVWQGISTQPSLEEMGIRAYGGELEMKLNQSTFGIVPYILMGGGYMETDATYSNDISADSLAGSTLTGNGFVSVGGGLSIPLGKGVSLFGEAKSILISAEDVSEVSSPSQVYHSLGLSAGLRITIAGKAKKEPIVHTMSGADNSANANSVPMDSTIVEEVQIVQSSLPTPSSSEGVVQMSPSEFNSLLAEVFEGISLIQTNNSSLKGSLPVDAGIKTVEMEKVDSLPTIDNGSGSQQLDSLIEQNAQLTMELDKLLNLSTSQTLEIDSLGIKFEQLSSQLDSEIKKLSNEFLTHEHDDPVEEGRIEEEKKPEIVDSSQDFVQFHSTSVIAGGFVGNQSTTVIGARWNYKINSKWNMFLSPETTLGLGQKVSYAFNAHIITPIPLPSSDLQPYAGLGGGILRTDEKNGLQPTYNFLVGVQFEFSDNRLFAEYLTGNLFDYNRLALGYTLGF